MQGWSKSVFKWDRDIIIKWDRDIIILISMLSIEARTVERQPRWLSGLMRSRVHSLWLLADHCVLRNWDRILVRAVKGLISRAGMVSICPLLWQRDVKLQQTYSRTCLQGLFNIPENIPEKYLLVPNSMVKIGHCAEKKIVPWSEGVLSVECPLKTGFTAQ